MRVLHIEGGRNLYGGSTQVVYLVKGLEKKGIENTVLCHENNTLQEKLAGNAEIITTSYRGELDIRIFFQIVKLIIRKQPDIIHIHSRRGVDFYGGLASFLLRKTCLLTRRVDNKERFSLFKIKYFFTKKIIAISDEIKNILVTEGLPENKVITVKSAINTKAISKSDILKNKFREEHNIFDPNTTLIVIVAQLIPRKGHILLLDAFRDVKKTNNNIRLFIYGRGYLKERIKKYIDKNNLQEHVYLKGFLSEIRSVLHCFDFLVHPAQKEGLGIALLEAASLQLPIVATRVGGIPEIVHDNVNGLLVQPQSKKSLSDAMLKLIQNPSLREKLGKEGPKIVKRDFSVEKMVNGNLQVYRSLFTK